MTLLAPRDRGHFLRKFNADKSFSWTNKDNRVSLETNKSEYSEEYRDKCCKE